MTWVLKKVPLDKVLTEKGQESERFSLSSRRSRYTQNIAIARNTSVMILEIDLCYIVSTIMNGNRTFGA